MSTILSCHLSMSNLEVSALPADVSVLVQDDLGSCHLVTGDHDKVGGGGADVSLDRVHNLSTLDHSFSLTV